MHVIHFRGGDKAAWTRLNKEQDLKHIRETPEARELSDQLLDL